MTAFSIRTAPERRVCRLPIASILPSPYQPRRCFDETELQSLAESIRRYGLLSPLLVRRCEDGYELIEVKLPCLLTTIKELNTPRYMTIAGIYGDKEMKVWNAKDIEVDLTKVGLEASPTNVFRSFTPAPKEPGVKIEGDTENEQAKNLLIKLKGKHII